MGGDVVDVVGRCMVLERTHLGKSVDVEITFLCEEIGSIPLRGKPTGPKQQQQQQDNNRTTGQQDNR